MPNQNTLKKIVVLLIILVIGAGVYFGITFYQASKTTTTRTTTNTSSNRTPFQTRTASGTDITITEDTPNTPAVENPVSATNTPVVENKLVQLWKEPVSGFDFVFKDIEIFSTSTATNTVNKKSVLKNQTHVYLWDRATGNIYQNLASTSIVERLSNHISPRAEEVFFVNPTTTLVRELDQNNENIITSKVELYKETATSTFFTATKKAVLVNTEHITYSQDTKKIFYFLKETGQAFVSNIDLSSTLNVLKTEIKEWIPQYVNRTTLAITTKPSAYFQGYLFFVNSTGTQDNTYVLGNKYGFTTLVSPDGKKILYNEIEFDLLQTSIYDIQTKKTIRLSQATLTDKCTWSVDSKTIYCAIPQQLALLPYPDVWYQRSTTFKDNIWSINPTTGEFTVEIALQNQLTTDVDAYNLKVSGDKKYLLFQDTYTLTLWKYTF